MLVCCGRAEGLTALRCPEQEVYLLTSLTSLSIGTLLVVCASLQGTHACVLLVFDLQLAMTS